MIGHGEFDAKPDLLLARDKEESLSAAKNQKHKCINEQRGNAAEGQLDKIELLVGRADFRSRFDSLLDGDWVHGLADAIAHALDTDQNSVRHGISEDHSFDRAIAYASKSHPDMVLINATTSVMVNGCIELGLLSRRSGRFILSMSYQHKHETFVHYTLFDAGFEWKRETLERG